MFISSSEGLRQRVEAARSLFRRLKRARASNRCSCWSACRCWSLKAWWRYLRQGSIGGAG